MNISNLSARIVYIAFSIGTAMIGYTIHNSIFWSIIDFIFPIIVWIVWLINHSVTLTIIKKTFSFFFV